MQIILLQIINYFLFFVFCHLVISPLKKKFHHAKAKFKPSKGVVIKSIALNELRKNKGKMTIEIKIKKNVDLIYLTLEKSIGNQDTVSQEHEINKGIRTFTV